MPNNVEFRQKDGKFEVFENGVHKHWSCDAIVVSMVASHPTSGRPLQITIVKRAHEQFGTQSTVVFDGKKPKEDDWFSGELFGSVEPIEEGVSIWSTKQANLIFPWPS